jgi:hypothetical protein
MELTRTVGTGTEQPDQSKHNLLVAFLILHNSVLDRHHIYNDPFHFDNDPDPDPDHTPKF